MDLRYESVPASDVASKIAWQQIADEIGELVEDATTAELVVAGNFARVVSGLAARVPWKYGGANESTPYNPQKPGSARASAKTVQLADRSVVVVDAAAAAFGASGIRRIAHHEAQHVRLRQGGDMAWALQRRSHFNRPRGYIYAFIYIAQSMLDEYRCEAAVPARITEMSDVLNVRPTSWGDVQSIFARARNLHRQTGDLEAVFAQVLAGLDRLGSFAGYAAATIGRGQYTRRQWSSAKPVLMVADVLLGLPGADSRLTPHVVLTTVTQLVHVLGEITESVGFRIDVDELRDQTALRVLD